jgi:hypothetical protein
MITIKLFFGGTPHDARNAYKAWWDRQGRIALTERPTLEREGKGWKLTVRYRSSN